MTSTSPTFPELYLIDGSGFIFRAFYAVPPLSRRDGTPVNAVLGFSNMILKLLKDFEGGQFVVVFDVARKTFRNEIYPDYKAHRPPPPEELIPQFDIVREATRAFGLPVLEQAGYEADDVIATYARQAVERGQNVTIVSSDKDLMQLVRDKVRLFDPMKNRMLGEKEVQDKFGVAPDKVIDVQALAGDSSDNVPGVPGIGVKTAAALIQEYGNLDTLLNQAADTIKQPKRRQALIDHADLARISRQLVTLVQDVPLPVSLDCLPPAHLNLETLKAFLREQGFQSIVSRLDVTTERAEIKPEYTLVQTEDVLRDWIAAAFKAGKIAIDTETDSLLPSTATLVGISLALQPGKACYIPLAHAQRLENVSSTKQIPLKTALSLLKPLLEDDSVLKIGHNIKYDMQVLAQHEVTLYPIEDTMILSYLLDGAAHGHGLDELSELFCNHTTIKFRDVVGSGKNQVTFDHVALDIACPYAAEDADMTFRLFEIFKPRLAQEKRTTLYESIERPLIPVLAKMETTGIKIDPLILKNMSTQFAIQLIRLEAEIHTLAGRDFNVASPKQIGEILFKDLNISGGKKTKTGAWSTDVKVLEKLATEGQDIAIKILEWRQLSKLKSTYTDALQKQIQAGGRVHTSFSMTTASTGRLSSTAPNLQNIPIRTKDGRRIRTAFVAEPGQRLLSVDYSQIELRLIAEIADIKSLKQAFQDGVDIHALTASEVFGVPLENMTSDLRRQAKAINFGIIYGISQYGLARQLSITVSDAKAFIDQYFARFPELQDYMETTKQQARTDGFVTTLFDRKIPIPTIHDQHHATRLFAERQAINAPIQGTAADIIKKAMIKIDAALNDHPARMLLQVHDELLFEVPKKDLEDTGAMVKNIMENIVSLNVPLIAEIGHAPNWAEAH